MCARSLLSVVVAAVLSTASAAARADDCDDMSPIEGARRAEAPAPLHAVEVVVPCAVADSGVVGPECPDAFYVVNHQGTVLCRVDLLAFAVDEGRPSVQPDESPAAAGTAFAAVALVPPAVPLPPPPVYATRPGAPNVADHGPADAHVLERPRPS
jgi:hypothetical protein